MYRTGFDFQGAKEEVGTAVGVTPPRRVAEVQIAGATVLAIYLVFPAHSTVLAPN
jgi:hypothetical protein